MRGYWYNVARIDFVSLIANKIKTLPPLIEELNSCIIVFVKYLTV